MRNHPGSWKLAENTQSPTQAACSHYGFRQPRSRQYVAVIVMRFSHSAGRGPRHTTDRLGYTVAAPTLASFWGILDGRFRTLHAAMNEIAARNALMLRAWETIASVGAMDRRGPCGASSASAAARVSARRSFVHIAARCARDRRLAGREPKRGACWPR